MKFFKLATAAALVAASLSASAMTQINDEQLSTVSGQDGVSIVADLNMNIGSFQYTDTDATGGSVSFDSIKVTGLVTMTIDILNAGSFTSAIVGAIAADSNGGLTLAQAKGVAQDMGAKAGYDFQSDVVQFAFPAATDAASAHKVSPSITISAIKMGSSNALAVAADTTGATAYVHTDDAGASFGSVAIKNLDLQGTKVWLFAH
jgi:hypothetical protein